MLRAETVKVVAFVSQVKPAQHIDEFTADAWHEVIGHLEFADAFEAVKRVARREKWIDPSEIIAEVKVIRRERLDKADPTFTPTCDPDDTREYQRQLLAHRKAVGDGHVPTPAELPQRPVTQLIENTFNRVPPAPLETLQQGKPVPMSPHTRALMRARLERDVRQIVDGAVVDEGGAA